MGDADQFERTIDQLLNDTKPLYEQLHAYVRGRLCSMYPNRFDCHGPIPAHILGKFNFQEERRLRLNYGSNIINNRLL